MFKRVRVLRESLHDTSHFISIHLSIHKGLHRSLACEVKSGERGGRFTSTIGFSTLIRCSLGIDMATISCPRKCVS